MIQDQFKRLISTVGMVCSNMNKVWQDRKSKSKTVNIHVAKLFYVAYSSCQTTKECLDTTQLP